MPEFSAEFWAATIVAGVSLLLGLGVTLAMDAKTKGEYRFAVGCFVFSALMIACSVILWGVTAEDFDMRKVALSALLFAVIGVALIAAIRWTRGRHEHASQPKDTKKVQPVAAEDEKPPTLAELFTKDFPSVLKMTEGVDIVWHEGGSDVRFNMKRQLYLDFPAKVKFVGFYIPSSDRLDSSKTFEACRRLVDGVRQALDDMPKKVGVFSGYRGEQNSVEDLTFSGRVVLYHDDFLSIPQKAAIISAYAAKHYDVQFRGPDYLGDQVIAWHHQHDPK